MGLGRSGQLVQTYIVGDFVALNIHNVHHSSGLPSASLEKLVHRDIRYVYLVDWPILVPYGLDDNDNR
jgi:hypothetical protein